MVKGIDKFRDFFADYAENYVIIGGSACEIYEEQYAQIPRATKDIDIILVVEALSPAFVKRFWEFVKAANYEERNKGLSEIEQEYYRFKKPKYTDFPYQVELFSRKIGLKDFPEDARITPIPVAEDLSSLSAILMDDNYYNFTLKNSSIDDGIHLANIESLICLKAKAYLDLSNRKTKGEQVNKKHIEKHKKDVFRLSAMLTAESSFDAPDALKSDIREFCEHIQQAKEPNADFFKAAGLPKDITTEQLIGQIKHSFNIK